MAQLVKCKTCGNDVAKSAKVCPKCGAPRSSISWITVLGGGFLLFVVCVGVSAKVAKDGRTSSEGSSTARPRRAEVAIELTARELEGAYRTNEVAADAAYKGRLLRVSGSVDTIGKGILDDPYVTLRSPAVLGGVMCTFSEKDNAVLARLSPGQKVTLRGRGGGYSMGSPVVRGCVVE